MPTTFHLSRRGFPCLPNRLLFVMTLLSWAAADAVARPATPLILDMVHHNPGEPRFATRYEDPAALRAMGINGKVYYLFDAPTIAVDWESIDPDIFPRGSPGRAWVDAKAAQIDAQHAACRAAGISAFAMADLVLLPKALIAKYHLEETYGDPRHPETERFLRALIAQMFDRFPLLDGLVVRIGETYLQDAPFHQGHIQNKRDADKTIIPLAQLLREEVCVKRGKRLVFRTWLSFDTDLATYLAVSDAVEPHPLFVFGVKHCEGDFHRGHPFSRILGAGRHPQLVEVQCAREYEGKGAYPNYIAHGVIEGFEEHSLSGGDDSIASIRAFTERRPELYAGVWTWTRGGGWHGPFITNELWPDLNAWVLAQWAADPTQSEGAIFLRYAAECLQLSVEDARRFRRLCLLSADATLRAKASVQAELSPWWSRDDGINIPQLPVDPDARAHVLADKAEAVRLWEEIVTLGDGITFPHTATAAFVRVSTRYGLSVARIYQAVCELTAAEAGNDADALRAWLPRYDAAWAEHRALPGLSAQCPTLYREASAPVGPFGEGLETFIARVRVAALPGSERRPVDWVEPRIDTVKPRWFYFGSAARPFGLVALSPDTHTEGDWNAGYRYRDTRIQCFSHLHEWQLAGLPFMPVTAATDLADTSSEFSHEDETVRPGYHRVHLRTHGITAELTSTPRVGFHRYTYPVGVPARVVLDLSKKLMECTMSDWTARANDTATELAGSVTLSRTHRRPKPVRLHFQVTFSRPFTRVGDGSDGRIVLDFGPLDAPLLMKVAPAFTDLEGARRNLAAELPHWEFDRVVAESRADWDSWLSRIEVDGGTPAQMTKFYTDLWHALLGRRILSDVDGRYPDQTGESFAIRQATEPYPHHNFDALWGAHWSLNLLWPMAWPEQMDAFAATMVRMYRDGGLIPRGPAGGNTTFVMIGDPAAPFFAAAHAKGIRNWDATLAYEGLRKNAFPGGIRSHAGYEHRRTGASGGGIAYYVERGYVPEDIPGGQGGHRQGAAMTLEYAYQDHALALLADALGKTDDAALFRQRAQNYRNVWDASTGWMRPRRLDGSWYSPFGPVAEGFAAKGFVESSSAVYSFHVPHDLPGLASLFGGPDAAADRLEENFRRAEPLRFITDHGKHAVAWVDYENQPSTQMAHLFSHFGRPWRSQYWVRRVHEAAFADVTPFGGYNGDEDQGQMGALSALMALGLFDVEGGVSPDPHYELTAPKFSRITIHLDPRYCAGRAFTITAGPQAPENVYIQSARLNGAPLNSFRFPHRVLTGGGTLELTLGPKPSESWGLSAP